MKAKENKTSASKPTSSTKATEKKALKRSETKSTTKNDAMPSRKIRRADELRVESNKAMQKLERIQKNWNKALSETKSMRKRREIDNKYSDKFEKANKKENESYERYSSYVHNNFGKKRIDYALHASQNFMSKQFINALGKKGNVK